MLSRRLCGAGETRPTLVRVSRVESAPDRGSAPHKFSAQRSLSHWMMSWLACQRVSPSSVGTSAGQRSIARRFISMSIPMYSLVVVMLTWPSQDRMTLSSTPAWSRCMALVICSRFVEIPGGWLLLCTRHIRHVDSSRWFVRCGLSSGAPQAMPGARRAGSCLVPARGCRWREPRRGFVRRLGRELRVRGRQKRSW